MLESASRLAGMKKLFTEEQIIAVLNEADTGAKVGVGAVSEKRGLLMSMTFDLNRHEFARQPRAVLNIREQFYLKVKDGMFANEEESIYGLSDTIDERRIWMMINDDQTSRAVPLR